jgi:hypothetical protein
VSHHTAFPVVYLGDLHKILPKLTEAVKAKKGG